MARKIVYFGDIEDLTSAEADGRTRPLTDYDCYRDPDDATSYAELGRRSYDYVSYTAQGPLAGLIWKEVRKCLDRANLTELQSIVIEMHLLGCSDAEIGDRLRSVDCKDRAVRTICQIRHNANVKLARIPNLGVLTVLYEEFRRRAVNELRTDRFECAINKNSENNLSEHNSRSKEPQKVGGSRKK